MADWRSTPRGWWPRHIAVVAARPRSYAPIRAAAIGAKQLGLGHPRIDANHRSAISLERIALLEEGIGVVVVPVALPEPRLVYCGQLDPPQPLRALPEVLAGDDTA